MKRLIFLTLILLTGLSIQAQDTTSVKTDTIQLTMLFSYCDFCNPMTDIGYAVVVPKDDKTTLVGYLDKSGRPLPESAIVWMIHKRKEEK